MYLDRPIDRELSLDADRSLEQTLDRLLRDNLCDLYAVAMALHASAVAGNPAPCLADIPREDRAA